MSAFIPEVSTLPIAFERDLFLQSLIGELSETLQDVVGLEEASAFVRVVGQRIGDQLNDRYKAALRVPRLTREQVLDVIVDLKRRVGGGFYVVEQDDDRIVLGNGRCPFAEKIRDRPAMCMTTSSLVGVIAARNLGYAKVDLEESIARGDSRCRVVVYLDPHSAEGGPEGREYFRS